MRFVEILSPDYLRALATSKYLINNATFPQQLAKRPEQVYVNTWHGVPLKHMGFDMPEGGVLSRNITRNFLNADYLLSANPYMTDTMYRSAYRMQGIFRGAVIEEGHPRTDRQAEALADPGPVRRRLEAGGVRVGDRKIILFAPTWRGATFQDPHVNAAQLMATVRAMQRSVDSSRYVVLLKVHQVLYRAVRERAGDCEFLVPHDIPTNLVLGVTDVLVTDYSSIFFDYLSTGRPVLHFVPDLDDYRTGRGLYLTEKQLPGPVSATVPELVGDLEEALSGPGRSPRTEAAAATYSPRDDGSVCSRVVDLVFRGADESRYAVRRDFGTEKERLLIYLGAMKSMGITTSALNLLRNLDYDRYDVTAFFVYSRGRDRAKNIALVDPRVRVIPRAPIYNAGSRRIRQETKRLLVDGLPKTLDERHREFWTAEWQRMFGHAQFDHLIDFSGYGCFTPVPLLGRRRPQQEHLAAQRHVRGHAARDHRREAPGGAAEGRVHDLPALRPPRVRLPRPRAGQPREAGRLRPAGAVHVRRQHHRRRPRPAHGRAQQGRGPRQGARAGRLPADRLRLARRCHHRHREHRLDDVDTPPALHGPRDHPGGPQQGPDRADVSRATTTFVAVGRLSPEKNHARLSGRSRRSTSGTPRRG